MPIINSILGEIDQELPTTLRVIERVPQDQLDWRPHPKSMPIGKLAWHIAVVPRRVEVMLREGELDVSTAGPTEMPAQAGAIAVALKRHMEDLRVILQAMDDDALKAPFTMRNGPKVLRMMPKIGVVRGILLNHTYHHRGQLSLYLRLLDIPVPAIYGNSADENPYA